MLLLNIWLFPQEDKMNRFLFSVLLLEQARLAYFTPWGILALFQRKIVFFWPHNNSFIDLTYSVKLAGYFLGSLSFCIFIDVDLVSAIKMQISTRSISIHLDLTAFSQ